MSIEERGPVVDFRPEMATFNAGSFNSGYSPSHRVSSGCGLLTYREIERVTPRSACGGAWVRPAIGPGVSTAGEV
jgi:hypothetical protein